MIATDRRGADAVGRESWKLAHPLPLLSPHALHFKFTGLGFHMKGYITAECWSDYKDLLWFSGCVDKFSVTYCNQVCCWARVKEERGPNCRWHLLDGRDQLNLALHTLPLCNFALCKFRVRTWTGFNFCTLQRGKLLFVCLAKQHPGQGQVKQEKEQGKISSNLLQTFVSGSVCTWRWCY